MTLEHDLQAAQQRLAAAEIRANSLRDTTPVDPGMFSGIRRKHNARADATRRNRYDREAEAFAILPTLEHQVHVIEHRIRERDRKQYTHADLMGVTHVVVDGLWWKVVRLNPKTVTVETAYSWTDRHPFTKITNIRTVTPQ